ncbi:hypothetical protein D9611_013648 [Ephemerocybe angulata]|uniref:FAS1 domain-containing protein n=1 Tax=Ephemerocybe angulata TaxID=980116 RepID=A0A8H5F0B1_9AGAR|nr:hypothetical protein D9611_013648 [Tulosesus angulatus]
MLPSIALLFASAFALLALLPFSIAHGIAGVIAAHRELSTLSAIINQYPQLLEALTSTNGTFLAPSNAAIDTFVAAQGADLSAISNDTIQALVSYHLLPTALSAANLSVAGGAIAQTSLLSQAYANLQGASNVVYASAYGSAGQDSGPSGLKVYSGVGTPANVTSSDLAYPGGFVHVIDRVLNFPQPCTKTAQAAQLSTLYDALVKANLTDYVDTTANFTCFAPTNTAFQAAGIDLAALSSQQLVDALKYHSIVGSVGYSTALEDGKEYQTLLGVPVTVHKRDQQLFINDVAVLQSNVIMSNGVAHVLSGVLTPPANATTTTSSASSTSTSPGGASTTGTAAGSSTGTAGNGAVSLSARGVTCYMIVTLIFTSLAFA